MGAFDAGRPGEMPGRVPPATSRTFPATERTCILLQLWHATPVAETGPTSMMIDSLPRREREIFELLCSAGEATAAGIRAAMQDPPSYSAVRTLLARLEARGAIRHRVDDQTYVYKSVPQPAKVRESALKSMVRTFFDGSAASAATALLGLTRNLSADEAEALLKAIREAEERE
jgi:predicted transcriptional regulator